MPEIKVAALHHVGRHAAGGEDPLTPSDIGAAPIAAIDNLSATATGLPPGSDPTVEVTGPIEGKVINVGIPRGEDGKAGPPGMGYEEGQQLLASTQAAQSAAETAATDAATIAANSIRDNLATDISTPGNPAYEALVDVAGDIGDPQTASLVTDTESATRAALDALLEGVSAKDPDIAGYVTDAESATHTALVGVVGEAFVAKGSIVVNAADHGVIGDGTTDDKVAFQAAMAAAGPGGTVLVPAGTTMAIPGATNIAAGVTISAHGATIQKIGASSGWWLRLGDGTRIDGARIDPAGLVTNSVVDASGRTGAALTDCTIVNTVDALNAVYLADTIRATVRDCTIDGASNGIRINGAGHDLTVTGNTVRNWQTRGIHTLGTDTGALVNAVFSGNRIIDFDGSIVFNEPGHVGQPFPIQAGAMPHRNVHVLHNIVIGNERAEEDLELSGVAGCISMHNVHGGVVAGNYCADGGEDAYTFSLGSKNLTVTGNAAIRMDGPGFHLRARNSTYTGNIAINCGQDRVGAKTNPHSLSGYWLSGVTDEMSGVVFSGNAAIDDQATRTMNMGVVYRDVQDSVIGSNIFRGLAQNYVRDSSSSTHARLHWTASTMSAEPVMDEHITLDAQPGWSGTEIKLWRRGGTVILSLRFRPATETTSGTSLLQLPEGWRPPSVVRAGAVSTNDEGANININGSGNVTVSWGTQPTGFLQASIPIPL